MDWLVDTNILVDHLRGVSKATTFLRQARSAGTLWLSAITVAEVYAGQGTRQSKQAAKVSRLLNLFLNRISRWFRCTAWRRDSPRLRNSATGCLDCRNGSPQRIGSCDAQHFALREHSQPQGSGSVLNAVLSRTPDDRSSIHDAVGRIVELDREECGSKDN